MITSTPSISPECNERLRDYDYLALSVLAAQSGGGVLKTNADISALISKRVEQAKRFYFLTFDPPRTEQVDEYHHIRVQAQRSGVDRVHLDRIFRPTCLLRSTK